MDKVIQFPSQQAQGWAAIERMFRKSILESGGTVDGCNFVLERLKNYFFSLDESIEISTSAIATDHFQALSDFVQSQTHKLLIRLALAYGELYGALNR